MHRGLAHTARVFRKSLLVSRFVSANDLLQRRQRGELRLTRFSAIAFLHKLFRHDLCNVYFFRRPTLIGVGCMLPSHRPLIPHYRANADKLSAGGMWDSAF